MEGERDCHASDSSKAGQNDDDCVVRWTVEEVSKKNKLLSVCIKIEIFLYVFSYYMWLPLLQNKYCLIKIPTLLHF